MYLCDIWYLLFCMDDCLVCIPDSHPYRIMSTKCRINTFVSPDDGHIVAQYMFRKEINILRKIVHQVGFIYKFLLVLPECLEEDCHIFLEHTLCFLLQFLDYTFKLSTEWHFASSSSFF